MKLFALIPMILILAFVMLAGCSGDSECPTCVPCNPFAQWTEYDNFNDNDLDVDLWNYIPDCCGGQVLEADGQLQVWGHTALWTGTGIVRSTKTRLAWKFDLVDAAFQEAPGCQGWHIRAIDPTNGAVVEVLNHCTVGCTDPPNWGDGAGAYEIMNEGDSLAVYLNGGLLRRLYDDGIDFFIMEFVADNMYSSGHYFHIFVDNVRGLEWKP